MSWAFGIVKSRETEDGEFIFTPCEIYMNEDGEAWGYAAIDFTFESKKDLIDTLEDIHKSCLFGKILDATKPLAEPDFIDTIRDIEADKLSKT